MEVFFYLKTLKPWSFPVLGGLIPSLIVCRTLGGDVAGCLIVLVWLGWVSCYRLARAGVRLTSLRHALLGVTPAGWWIGTAAAWLICASLLVCFAGDRSRPFLEAVMNLSLLTTFVFLLMSTAANRVSNAIGRP